MIALLQAFFAIFVIMDALGNIPLFWSLSQKLNKKQRRKSINKAVTVATLLVVFFIFTGDTILKFFGISISSFQIAGGLIILIIGIEMVLGFRIREKRAEKYEFAVVPLATPLITGPGVITTVILLVSQVGVWITLLAALLNILVIWLALTYSDLLYKFLGRQGADVSARIMGLILASLAVEFIRKGWLLFV